MSLSVEEVVFDMEVIPATFNWLPIPTPPLTINAPVSSEVEEVVFDIEVIPATFNWLPMPTPPETTKAPDDIPVDSTVLVNDTIPVALNVPATSNWKSIMSVLTPTFVIL